MVIVDPVELDGFPLVVRPAADGHAHASVLSAWLSERRKQLADLLREHGAVLFRGFAIHGADAFEGVCRAATPGLLDYAGGGSPRRLVAGRVYTSTEYPADQAICLHCEESYFEAPPRHIWFYCERPAAERGETPIGDMVRVIDRLDGTVVEDFRRRGVRYIYNLHGGDGFGRGWREAFGTDDRGPVDAWLAAQRAAYHWSAEGHLHIDLLGPGLRTHPETGAVVWGNQATNWHVSGLPAPMAASMRRLYESEAFYPKHATFADGSAIPDVYIHHILAALATEETAFAWEREDVLLCDNHRVAHGRRPFTGERRVLVALA